MNRLYFLVSCTFLWTTMCGCSDVPPSTKDPDPTPPASSLKVELATKWEVGPDNALGEIATASAGEEAAIVYAESESWTDQGFAQTRIKLQRMVKTGAFVGAAVELGVIPFEYATKVTVATDGNRYLACWSGTDDVIACANVPVGQGEASAAYSGPGHSPALAYGPKGFAMARSLPNQLAIVYLDENGAAVGSDIIMNAVGAENAAVLLNATPSGYLLAGESDGSMRLHSLNDSLSELSIPVNLNRNYWFSASIASSEGSTAVHLAKPYGGTLLMLDSMVVQETYEYDDSNVGKTGLDAVVTADETTFGVLSIDGNGGFRYGRAGGESSAPPAEVVFNFNGGAVYNPSVAIADIQGERFFVTASGWPTRGGSMVITRLIRN